MIEEAESLQKMQNMIQTKQYSKALEIALRLGRPGNAFDTLKLLSQDEIHSLVKKLSNTNKFKLLEFWNGLQKKYMMSVTAQGSTDRLVCSRYTVHRLSDFCNSM